MKKYNINTHTFDNISEKTALDKLLDELKEPLEKIREDLEHKAVLNLTDDVTWLKRNLIITQICFGVAIIALAIGYMLK